MIRTLLVDDSSTFRLLIQNVLSEDPEFEVVGVAQSGHEAVLMSSRLKPDLVVMDFMMPGMSGLQATHELMCETPCPVVILSGMLDASAQQIVFEALKAGAVDVLPKPRELGHARSRAQLRASLRAMASVKVIRQRRVLGPGDFQTLERRFSLCLIGASTGGPPALAELLASLKEPLPFPIVIAQHLASGFAVGLRAWLHGCSPLGVELATTEGTRIVPGHVYLAPDDHHLQLSNDTIVAIPAKTGETGVMPSVANLFDSALPRAPDTVAILLTGMGQDGAEALKRLREAGAYTIVQDRASSLVYGMPKVAKDIGAALEELPISEFGRRLIALGRGAGST